MNREPSVTMRDLDFIKRTLEAYCGPHQPALPQETLVGEWSSYYLTLDEKPGVLWLQSARGLLWRISRPMLTRWWSWLLRNLDRSLRSRGSKTSEYIPTGGAAKTELVEYEAMKDEDWEMISQA